MLWRITRHVLAMAATVLLGGLLSATLVRFAPGFEVDQQQLDARLNSDSLRALRDSRSAEKNTLRFYGAYLSRVMRGDLGTSRSLGQPVRSLLRDRFPVTLRLVLAGLGLGWLFALSLSLTATMLRATAFNIL